MDKVKVINLTAVTQHVGVIHSDGTTKDSVQIMPKRRVELRVGMTVDPKWLGLNIGAVRIQHPVAVKTLPPVIEEPVAPEKALIQIEDQGDA